MEIEQRVLPPGAGYSNWSNSSPPHPPPANNPTPPASPSPRHHQHSQSTPMSLYPHPSPSSIQDNSLPLSSSSGVQPVQTRRPSLPYPPPSSPPLQSMPTRSPLPSPPAPLATAPAPFSPSSDELPLASAGSPPLQFSPIPLSFSSPSPPPVLQPQQIHQVYTSLPSFVPAPAFSNADRGPYPPHARRRESASQQQQQRESTYGEGSGSPRSVMIGIDSISSAGAGGGRSSTSPSPIISQGTIGMTVGPGVSSPKEEEDRLETILPPSNNSNKHGPSYSYPSPAPSPTPQSQDQNLTGIGLRNSLVLRPASYPLQSSSSYPGPSSPPPAHLQQPQSPPPHLVPQPEVCVECMMRDRDMIDVDVTSPGVWDREADMELDAEDGTGGGSSEGSSGGGGDTPREKERRSRGQALTVASLKLWTSMNPPAAAHRWRTLQSFLATQSHLIELERHAREQTAVEVEEHQRRVRSGSGSYPSVGASFPAPTGRNRSSTMLPNGLVVETVRVDKDEKKGRDSNGPNSRRGKSRVRAQSDDDEEPRRYTSGDQPWLSSQGRRVSGSGGGKDRDSLSLLSAGGGGGATRPTSPSSVRSRGFGFGRFGARSSVDLRSLSPSRASVDDRRASSMWSKFRQSASQSVYSFAPSGSMMDMHLGLSMDKHQQAGLIVGGGGSSVGPYGTPYETYGGNSVSDSAVQRLNRGGGHGDGGGEEGRRRREEGEGDGKKRKKGFKGFLSKLIGGSDKDKKGAHVTGDSTHPYIDHGISASASTTPYLDPSSSSTRNTTNSSSSPRGRRPSPSFTTSDEFLAPPPPLSALVNEPRYHARSGSSSSLDSLQQPPFTPPLHHTAQHHFKAATDTVLIRSPGAADRGSVITNGSYSSMRSGGQRSLRPSMDYLAPEGSSISPPRGGVGIMATAEEEVICPESSGPEGTAAGLRKEKSLPSLPSEAHNDDDHPHPQQHSYSPHPSPYGPNFGQRETRSAYSIRTPSLSPTVSRSYYDEEGSMGGGKKSRARSKVFSMNFGGFNRHSGGKKAADEEKRERESRTKVAEQALKGIGREGALVSVRF